VSYQAVFADYVSELRAAARSMTADYLVAHPNSMPWAQIEASFRAALEAEALRQMNRSGLAAVFALKLPKDKEARLKFFTVDNPYAVNSAAQHSARLVVEINQGTRDAISDIVRDGFTRHRTVQEIGRDVRARVGLHSKDTQAVGNYYNDLLEANVNPALREKLVADYSGKLLRNRGLAIARTETAFALGAGKLASWLNARDNGFVTSYSRKRWFTKFDETTCDVCGPLHNVTVGLDEPFPGGFMHEPAHPHCQCSVNLITLAPGTTWKEPTLPSEAAQERRREAAREHRNAQARRFRARWRKVPEGDE
jgi:hypothetical protein